MSSEELQKEMKEYGMVKERLMVELISGQGNEALLKTVPHSSFEDMQVVYRFANLDSTGQSTDILIDNKMMDFFGITEDQLYRDAMEYAPVNMPVRMETITEALEVDEDPEMTDSSGSMLYVATSESGFLGASVLTYPGFMDQAAEKLEGDFYILPSSIHETILLKDNGLMTVKELEEMVRSINRTEVSPEEHLSDHVYHYDCMEKRFERADLYDDRISEQENPEKSVLKELMKTKDRNAEKQKLQKHSRNEKAL